MHATEEIDAKADLLAAAIVRLKRKHGAFTINLGFEDLLVLIAHLQLALRHPDNAGHARERAQLLVDDILAALETSEPGLRELLCPCLTPSNEAPQPRPPFA